MFAAMMITPTRYFEIGPYSIRQHPLSGNPYWATHWIYRGAKLVGKLLSVPSLADCEYFERQARETEVLYWAENGDNKKARLRGVAKTRKRKAD